MIRCIAIDDEPLALKLIGQYISRLDGLRLTGSFDDAVRALDFIKENPADLLIIDINMPDLNGLQLVESLQDSRPLIIFTTAYREYAVEGFQLDAVDYLLKPVTFERFETAVQKARQRLALLNTEAAGAGSLVVYSEYSLLKIPFREIEYIASMSDYIKIHLVNTKHPVLSLNSLKSVSPKLPAGLFSRIHRSFIVGHEHIRAVRGKKVVLNSGEELPVSQTYAPFLEKWKKE